MAEKLFNAPAIPTPSIEKLKQLASKFGLDLTDEELKDHQGTLSEML